jgi:hypothetical protein
MEVTRNRARRGGWGARQAARRSAQTPGRVSGGREEPRVPDVHVRGPVYRSLLRFHRASPRVIQAGAGCVSSAPAVGICTESWSTFSHIGPPYQRDAQRGQRI